MLGSNFLELTTDVIREMAGVFVSMYDTNTTGRALKKKRRYELRMSCMRHIRASEGSGAASAATTVEFEATTSKTQDWLLPAAPSIPLVGWG